MSFSDGFPLRLRRVARRVGLTGLAVVMPAAAIGAGRACDRAIVVGRALRDATGSRRPCAERSRVAGRAGCDRGPAGAVERGVAFGATPGAATTDTRGLYRLVPQPERTDRALTIRFSRMFDVLR